MRLICPDVQSAETGANGRRARPRLRGLTELGDGDVRWSSATKCDQIQERIDDLIVCPRTGPDAGCWRSSAAAPEDIVVHDDGVIGWVVEAMKIGAVGNDVIGGI